MLSVDPGAVTCTSPVKSVNGRLPFSVTNSVVPTTENVPGADRMVADVRADRSGSRLVRDYSGLHSLMSEMDVLNEVEFDWGLAVVKR